MDAPIDYFTSVKNLERMSGLILLAYKPTSHLGKQYLHFHTVTEKNLDSIDRNWTSVAKNKRIFIKKQATSW